MPATRHRAPLLWIVAPFGIGILAAHAFRYAVPAPVLLVGAFLGLGVAAVLRHRPLPLLGGLSVALACAGALHYLASRGPWPWPSDNPAREVLLRLEVERWFSRKPGRPTAGGIGVVREADPPLASLGGRRVRFSLRPPPAWDGLPPAGTVLRGRGVLLPLPRPPPAGSFEAHVDASGCDVSVIRMRVEAVTPPGRYARVCAALQARFEGLLRVGVEDHPEGAPVLRAMLLGQSGSLPEDQRDLFIRTGALHLFAISGLHVLAIGTALSALLSVCRLPAWLSALAGVGLLRLFVDATGASPSALRAWTMMAWLGAARMAGLPTNPLAGLCGAALVSALLHPFDLLGAGFQMSYLIVLVLLCHGTALASRLGGEPPGPTDPDPDPEGLPASLLGRLRRAFLGACAMALSAAVPGTLCGVAYFQWFTPAGVLANLVMIPLSSLALYAGIASLLCGLAGITPACVLFNHAGIAVIAATREVAALCAALPGGATPAAFTGPLWGPCLLGSCVAIVLWGHARQWRPAWTLTLPFALLIVAIPGMDTDPKPVSAEGMKSAYELAMERLAKADPAASRPLTAGQKDRLAEIDRVYQGRLAEREIFLKKRLDEALAGQDLDEIQKIKAQMASEKARIEEEREAEKERVRNG